MVTQERGLHQDETGETNIPHFCFFFSASAAPRCVTEPAALSLFKVSKRSVLLFSHWRIFPQVRCYLVSQCPVSGKWQKQGEVIPKGKKGRQERYRPGAGGCGGNLEMGEEE